MKIQVEVVCDSVADAMAAARAGADRIELGTAPTLGGLTPSTGLLEAVCERVEIPVVALVRPRPGGFCVDPDTRKAMERDIRELLRAGADAVVTGVLTGSGAVDRDSLRRFIDAAGGGSKIVFHRALDVCSEIDAAFDVLRDLGVGRVLTSGGEPTALAGAAVLKRLVERGSGHTDVLPAGGIRASNAVEVVMATGCTELHLGPRRIAVDPTCSRRGVDYGNHTVCDDDAVAAVVAALRGAS